MIKCSGYGKLLKLFFSIGLIGFFGLLGNFSEARIQYVGLDKYPSNVNQNYEIGFIKGGGVITDFIGVNKSVAGFDLSRLFWWSTNGLPYVYLKSNNGAVDSQGFYDRFFVCDELTTIDELPSNCSLGMMIDYSGTLALEQEFLNSFFKKVYADDLVYYNSFDTRYVGATWNYQINGLDICWSSHELSKSICFRGGHCVNNYTPCAGALVNSQNLSSLTFGNVSNSWIGKAPGHVGYGGFAGDTQGSVEVNVNNSYSGDYIYQGCTNGDIINSVENSGISEYLCRGGLDNFDDFLLTGIYNSIPGTGKWLDEIYGQTSEGKTVLQWFNFWQPIYVNQYVSSVDNRLNKPAVLRSYFKIYNDYGGANYDFNTVYEYCLMKFASFNTGFVDSKYNGTYFKDTCTTIINDKIINNQGNAGEGVVGLNWDGVGSLSGLQNYNDPGKFITDMFTKIKSYIPTDNSGLRLGFLPTFIITFMLFLILFRFLSH